MVTLPLERMASRVCASLCTAAGFGPQMVVNSQKEYEERAVALGTNPEMLANLRRDLREARTSCELFNTRGWVEVSPRRPPGLLLERLLFALFTSIWAPRSVCWRCCARKRRGAGGVF